MDRAAGEVHKLVKKNETNIFPVRTEQASSMKFLLLWLCFEFPDGTAHCMGDKKRKIVFITPFSQNFFQNFWSNNNKKRFLLNVKMFSFEFLLKNTNQ